MRAVAYCRVSTIETDQLNSLQNQKEHYQELFKKEGFDKVEVGLLFKKHGKEETREHLDGIFADEGISGTKLKNREAFNYMVELAKRKEFDIIYVKNVARFGRCVEDGAKTLKDLKGYGVEVIFEDGNLSSINNEMVINMFLSVAQEESRNKSVAIQFGVQKAQKKGKWNSGVPYGYTIIDGFLQINENEIETVKQIFDMYLNEGWGTGKIARWLNDESILTKKGKQWSQPQIGSILDNCIFTGKQVNHTSQTYDVNRNTKQEIDPSEWNIIQREELRIISDDQFRRIETEREKRRDMLKQGTRTSSENLLSNILYCGNCGSCMKRKKRHTYNRKNSEEIRDIGYEWTCSKNDMYGKSKCDTRNAITEELAIQLIKDNINIIKSDTSEFTDAFKQYYIKNFKISDIEGKKAALTTEIEYLKKKSKINLDLLTDAIITREQYREQNNELQKELIIKESELNKLIYIKKEIENALTKFKDFMQEILEVDTENLTNPILKKLIFKASVNNLKSVEKKKGLFDKLTKFMQDKLKTVEFKITSDDFIKSEFKDNKNSIIINWNFMDSNIIAVSTNSIIK
ncbi:MAG TPA: recombinase family protein [Ruminiclostridium sp.]